MTKTLMIPLALISTLSATSLQYIYSKHLSDKTIDINMSKTFYGDFDGDGIQDIFSVNDKCMAKISIKNEIKEFILAEKDDIECPRDISVSSKPAYAFFGFFGTDYGDMYVYSYDKLLNNWFIEGMIHKSVFCKRKIYDEERYSNQWSIDRKILRIRAKDTLLSLEVEIKEKNNQKKYTEIQALLKSVLLENLTFNFQNISQYNNIAYYLQQAGANQESAYLLGKIIEKFPDRTVAYLNLGDAYYELGNKDRATKAYQIYIEQMKKKEWEKKIPKRVLERVGVAN